MKVLKFGGSSVGSPEIIRQVKTIIESQTESCIVVVSAFKGITDQLVGLSNMAMQHNDAYKKELKDIEDRHFKTVSELIPPGNQKAVTDQVRQLVLELEGLLNGIFLLQEYTPKALDKVLSFGERLSAYIISNVIEKGKFHDSRNFIRTNSNFGAAKVDFDTTENLILQEFKIVDHIPIIPGFIASTELHETTTLGRGGSDYTAAIIASVLNASILEIWSDVDGFMTADPRKVSKAYAIHSMTYAEAIELSHFGAKVIYTPTIQPVYKKNIPILIKNTFKPSAKGTTINSIDSADQQALIKGISSIDEISLVSIQGAGMVGVTGISMRIFRALAKYKVNVILITQASSEFSICIAVVPSDAHKAKEEIGRAHV
jgi:bifunctional aspartokinase / homoserine dehydrogenase 1